MRQILCPPPQIEPVAQIAMAGPYRGVRIGHRDGLQSLTQRGQDRGDLIVVFVPKPAAMAQVSSCCPATATPPPKVAA